VIFRGHWFSWSLHGFWFRETPRGEGWCLKWWGTGLLHFERYIEFPYDPPIYSQRGPYYLLPVWRFGPIRFYYLDPLE